MIRVGIVGCGRIADLHVVGYRGRVDAKIVALCDLDLAHLEDRKARWGLANAKLFTNHQAMFDSGLVDMVEILVPHHLHYSVATDAILAGLHVSLQKPMTLTLTEADELVALAAQSKRQVRLYENFMFYPPVRIATELVESGAIGDVISVRQKSLSGQSPNAWQVPAATQAWRLDPAACGGGPLVFDDGHHKFALSWLYCGPAQSVHAWIGETESAVGPLDAPALVSVRHRNETISSLEVVHARDLVITDTEHYAQDDRLEITGTAGVIWVNRGHGQVGEFAPVACYSDGRYETFDCPTGWEQSFVGATQHFLDALGQDKTATLSLAQGRDILAMALAAQASAARQAPIEVEVPVGAEPETVRPSVVGHPTFRAED